MKRSVVLGLAHMALHDGAVAATAAGCPCDRDSHGRQFPAELVGEWRNLGEPGVYPQLLREFRRRHNDLATGRYVDIPDFHFVEVVPVQHHHHGRDRHVGAYVPQDNGAVLFVPLDTPIHQPAFSLAAHLPLEEQVGVLAELVRLFSDAVRHPRLVQSVPRETVGNLCLLIGVLRSTVREYSDQAPDSTNGGCADVEGVLHEAGSDSSVAPVFEGGPATSPAGDTAGAPEGTAGLRHIDGPEPPSTSDAPPYSPTKTAPLPLLAPAARPVTPLSLIHI